MKIVIYPILIIAIIVAIVMLIGKVIIVIKSKSGSDSDYYQKRKMRAINAFKNNNDDSFEPIKDSFSEVTEYDPFTGDPINTVDGEMTVGFKVHSSQESIDGKEYKTYGSYVDDKIYYLTKES